MQGSSTSGSAGTSGYVILLVESWQFGFLHSHHRCILSGLVSGTGGDEMVLIDREKKNHVF